MALPVRSALNRLACITVLLTFGIPASLGAQQTCNPDPYKFQASRFPKLNKKYSNSIILVNCGGELPDVRNMGTGFLINSRIGLFLTAHHVIKNEYYDCTNRNSQIVAYPSGDMCQQMELEYVAGDELGLDVALLQIKSWHPKHFFYNKPHLELLTQGMRVSEPELELIGFSQFAAILDQDAGSSARQNLPGRAGGNTCDGQPQPYTFNPVMMFNQRIDGRGPTYVRDSNVRHGDSGGPILLEDGRVGGLVTEIGLGLQSPGTKVISGQDIVSWLVSVLRSKESLQDHDYLMEAWAESKNIYSALNPDDCISSNSCVPNVRIAAELERIRSNAVRFETFTKAQLEKLRCPLYTAAKERDIGPQVRLLREKLVERGLSVAAERDKGRIEFVLANPKYTAYTKMAALEFAEASLAKDLDDLSQKYPDILPGAICASGVDANQVKPVKVAVDNYLQNFRQTEFVETSWKTDGCPENLSATPLKQVKALTSELSDIKIAQASLIKKLKGPSDPSLSAAAAALAALVNVGDKKTEAGALIDVADAFVKKNPEFAAGAYARAFDIDPSARAVNGFGDAVSRSSELQEKVDVKPSSKTDWKKFIVSYPTIDQNSVAALIRDPGLKPGAMIQW